jgi:hypothetical protein
MIKSIKNIINNVDYPKLIIMLILGFGYLTFLGRIIVLYTASDLYPEIAGYIKFDQFQTVLFAVYLILLAPIYEEWTSRSWLTGINTNTSYKATVLNSLPFFIFFYSVMYNILELLSINNSAKTIGNITQLLGSIKIFNFYNLERPLTEGILYILIPVLQYAILILLFGREFPTIISQLSNVIIKYKRLSIFCSVLFFAMLHGFQYNSISTYIFSIIPYIILGLLFALVRLRYSLLAAIVIHSIWNTLGIIDSILYLGFGYSKPLAIILGLWCIIPLFYIFKKKNHT